MIAHLRALPLAALLAVTAPAAAAERNFGITGFEKVRVEGPFKVTLTTGIAPFARASGSPTALEAVSIEMLGSTLIVRNRRSGAWGGYPGAANGPVEIALGTHDVSSASLTGAGSLAIDRAKSFRFDLTVNGSGSARIADVAVDQLRVAVVGSGSAGLAGSAGKLTATVSGSGALDGATLAAKDATIAADGSATVRLAVSNGAKIDANGASSVELSGNPACTAKTVGSASVSGCR